MKKTPEEIKAEIAALEDCKTRVPRRNRFEEDNHEQIDAAIEYLKGEIDTTAPEFGDMSDDEQLAVNDAEAWKEGMRKRSPSEEWNEVFPPKKKG